MTAVETYYASGHCAVGSHDRCRGAYAGVDCGCPCQHQPAEPAPPPAPARHCATCTCGDHA